jgi:hypothetical protein
MGFPQNKQKNLAWQTWLNQNRDELGACGVPPSVVENRERWFYFLDHGYYTPEGSAIPSINIDCLDAAKALQLCLFLEKDGASPNSATLNRLQYLLKRGCHSGMSV